MDLEGIILSDVSQRRTNTIWPTYMRNNNSKERKLTQIQRTNYRSIAKCGDIGGTCGEWAKWVKEVKSRDFQLSDTWVLGCNNMVTLVNIVYLKFTKRIDCKRSYHTHTPGTSLVVRWLICLTALGLGSSLLQHGETHRGGQNRG